MKHVYMRMTNIVLFVVLITLVIYGAGCTKEITFSGSKTGSDVQFLVDFDVLNTTVYSKMQLSEGDIIEVSTEIEKGDAEILVKNENDKVAYEADDIGSSNCAFEIIESGIYTFYLTGRKAQGSVYFIKSSSLPGTIGTVNQIYGCANWVVVV
ncbi:MAG: hypothetical protein PHE08_07865 [Bacteroidales bacterium]|nr:hypothetical protein [Bacteroidales bacterium]